jgi:hypothetical protein
MKIALCTTSIHALTSFPLLRKGSNDVRFFVALDKKSPPEIYEHADANTKILTLEMQGDWKCSEALTWNSMARRNVAFLEALKWKADVIYSHDVDNYPTGLDHFVHLRMLFAQPFNGLKVFSPDGWFDPGSLLIPPTRHRGIPHHLRPSRLVSPVTDVKVGVAAGLIIGNPDVDASTRIEHSPDIGSVHVFGDVGIVVDPGTHTVFNTQNTAIIREFVPAWFLMPGVGRHDDIYASLIVQRVMRECGYHVHFGKPIAFQERHPHNLLTDLRAEIDGMEKVEQIADMLDGLVIAKSASVISTTADIYYDLMLANLIPAQAYEAAVLWLEDCEEAMR